MADPHDVSPVQPKNYPASGFPFSFYFNGEVLPRWASCWMSCASLQGWVMESLDEWDYRVTGHDFWLLSCRIDHVGMIESEDPLRLRVCVRTMLVLLLRRHEEVEREAVEWARNYGATGAEVVRDIRDGLIAMDALTRRDGFAAWTNGIEKDQLLFSTFLRSTPAPALPAEWKKWPHLFRDRREGLTMLDHLRKDLVKMIHAGEMPKELRQAIHQMPQEWE